MQAYKKHLIITLAVMAFIFIHSAMPGKISSAESGFFTDILSALTGLGPESLSFFVRKAAHFTEFMVLGISLGNNARGYIKVKGKRKSAITNLLLPWLAGTVYAVSDELHQIFVPERAFAITDICIDSAGVLVGVVVIFLMLKGYSDEPK